MSSERGLGHPGTVPTLNSLRISSPDYRRPIAAFIIDRMRKPSGKRHNEEKDFSMAPRRRVLHQPIAETHQEIGASIRRDFRNECDEGEFLPI
jgi:hypothetical protein